MAKDVKSVFSYAPAFYTPEGARWATEEDMAREYSRLRSIAQKRLSRLAGSEYAESSLYKEYMDGFDTVREVRTAGELSEALANVARFLRSSGSTLTGAAKVKAMTLDKLHERGYNFVNNDNYWQYTRFMDYARGMLSDELWNSEYVNDFFERAQEAGASESQMKRWFKHWVKSNGGGRTGNVTAANADFFVRR